MPTTTDRIEKKVLLRAPRQRVWRAITDSRQFGTWFGVRFDGPFAAGSAVSGKIVPTAIDAEVAASQKPYEGMPFQVAIENIEPMRRFSFRWHPGGADAAIDPTTLVVFELEEVAGGTMLTLTESGFDAIPLERRAKVFAGNEAGWAAQMNLIQKYLALHPEG